MAGSSGGPHSGLGYVGYGVAENQSCLGESAWTLPGKFKKLSV